MADNVPYNFRQEQEKLARRRQLAEALRMQGMGGAPQGQMVSGHYVAPGLLSTIAPLVQAFAGQKMDTQIDQDTTALGSKYREAMAQSLEDYLKERQTNPEAAARRAMTSEFEPLQTIAAQDMKKLQESMLTGKDLLKAGDFSPESRIKAIQSGGNLDYLQGKEQTKVINGQLFKRGADGQFTPVLDARDTYGPVGQLNIGPDGKPIMGQVNLSTNKASFAPGGINIDTTTKAGNAFGVALAKERADVIKGSYTNALNANKALEAMDFAAQDLDAGIKSGITANVSLTLARIGKALGMEEVTPEIANTQSYRANMARETMQLVKNLGSGTAISNSDREFAEKASGGDITLDDKAMLRLINIARAASGNVLIEHNRLLDASLGSTGAIPADIETFRLPSGIEVGKEKIPGQVYYDEEKKKYLVAPEEKTSVVPEVNQPPAQPNQQRKVYNYNEM